jgi:haloalkane dehalogenase
MGIRTVGSWICGWDFHNHTNIEEDLNYFVSLNPTYQQLTRLSPFPGTALWYQLKKEGRLKNVPWEDVHFWSGTQKNLGLEEHETLNYVEHGYDLLYRTWGPSMLRRLDVELNGYDYCKKSSNPVLHDHKSVFFRKQCGMVWTLLAAMEKFAPNSIVRRRVKQTGKKYLEIIGEPTPVMQYLSKNILRLASGEYMKQLNNPSFYGPKLEPFKKYIYHKSSNENEDIPYRTEWPTKPSFKVRKDMFSENFRYFALEQMMKLKRSTSRSKSDPIIDDYLMGMVNRRAFGFGL